MGRYYNGDIEGKFWFGLQPSDAPSRFGGIEQEPAYITYNFEEHDLEEIEEEIKNIQENLGEKFGIIDKFFEDNNSYNDAMLEEIGIGKDDLREYADLQLGIKIRDCVREQGYCTFDCEI
jgi:hypothetical protein